VLYLVGVGCFLDVLSTFFPWSEIVGRHWFLPFSIPLPLGWNVYFLEGSVFFLAISVATRLAAVLGLAGLFLYIYRKRVLSRLLFFISIGLSFVSFVVFSLFGLPLYLGVWIVLVGGFLKLVGLILKNLEVEVAMKDKG